MSQSMGKNSGYKIVDWDPRARRWVTRNAGKGAAWRDRQRSDRAAKQRMADGFGRLGNTGYGGGAGGAGFSGYAGVKKLTGHATKAARLARWVAKMNPLMRSMDVAGQLMDVWAKTQEENPFDMPAGWSEVCTTGPGPYEAVNGPLCIRTFQCSTQHSCGTLNQIIGGTWGPGSQTPPLSAVSCVGTSSRWRSCSFAFGPIVFGGIRMDFHKVIAACWDVHCSVPQVVPEPVRYLPAVIQPVPGTLAPPDPMVQEQWQPRGRTRADPKMPPYVDGDGHVNLPHPGKPKWKLSRADPGGIKALYGALTETKDALKCLEKNLGITPKGGLHNRLARALFIAYHEPNRVNKKALVKCIVGNQIEDAVIGKANQLANRITKSPYWVRPVGVGAGSWVQRMN